MNLEWLKEISVLDAYALIDLMNTVSFESTNDIIGYWNWIEEDQGMATVKTLSDQIHSGSLHLLVARDDNGRIVGMLSMSRNAHPCRNHIADLGRCIVEPQHKGRFFLRAWHLVLTYTQALGCETITLDVRSTHTRAERLWRRLGFIEYGRLPDFCRIHGQATAGIFYYADIRALLGHYAQSNRSLHHLSA